MAFAVKGMAKTAVCHSSFVVTNDTMRFVIKATPISYINGKCHIKKQ